MNILNVVNVYFTLPYFLGNQIKFFTRQGHNIHVVCSPSDKLKLYAYNQGCKYSEIKIDRRINPLSDIISVVLLWKYIRKNNFDIVVGHTPKAGLLAMLAARLAGVKKRVFFRHGLNYETATGIKRSILIFCEKITSRLSTKIICVSNYLIERSIKDRISPKDKMSVLNIGSCNGVDAINTYNPDNINPNEISSLRDKLGISKTDFIIGFVGRLVKDKGISELVDAFEILNQENAKLLLVGPLENGDALPLKTVERIKSNPNIIYVGLVENGLELYYSLMNVFILPTHREGFGVSLLEAQAMSIPVLTTAHTGARDAIKPNESGEFIDLSIDSIAQHLLKYINSPELAKQYGANGRQFVLDNFSEQSIWEEINRKVYNS